MGISGYSSGLYVHCVISEAFLIHILPIDEGGWQLTSSSSFIRTFVIFGIQHMRFSDTT